MDEKSFHRFDCDAPVFFRAKITRNGNGNDAVCGHKYYVCIPITCFALTNTGASRSKRQEEFSYSFKLVPVNCAFFFSCFVCFPCSCSRTQFSFTPHCHILPPESPSLFHSSLFFSPCYSPASHPSPFLIGRMLTFKKGLMPCRTLKRR